jgi:hypothetical protein
MIGYRLLIVGDRNVVKVQKKQSAIKSTLLFLFFLFKFFLESVLVFYDSLNEMEARILRSPSNGWRA